MCKLLVIQNPDYPFEIVYQKKLNVVQIAPFLTHFETHGISINGRAYPCELVSDHEVPSLVARVMIDTHMRKNGLKLRGSTRKKLPFMFNMYLDDCE